MNLRVDLMLDTERRSPSVLNVKLLARVSAVVVPAILALIVAMSMLRSTRAKAKVREMEAEWSALKKKKEAAEKLSTQLGKTKHLWKAIEGWPAARVNFSEHLAGLFAVVPAEIQLTSLNITHELKPGSDGVPARFYTMSLEGKSVGVNAEENIRLLVSRLKTEAPFAGQFQTVTMRGWADRSEKASRNDRLFAIACVYQPKGFVP